MTNKFGIEWLKRHLGNEYKVHEVSFNDPHAVHVDISLGLLKPGLAFINPDQIFDQRVFFEKAGWKVSYTVCIIRPTYVN